jgi:hypothetical protein
MEKRKHARIALKPAGWQAELIDQLSGEKLGDVVNLSTNGLMMITSKPIESDSLYQLECISRGPYDQVARFSAGVSVLWTSPASQPNTTWAGLEIIDINLESRQALLALSVKLVDG